MNKNRGLTPLAVVLMLSGSLALTGCDDKQDQQGGQQMPEVGVVTLKTEPLQITTELPGRTVAYRIAEVRPQVSGIILKRNFVEGSDIEAGVSLYQIDPATYQATYDSAKGDLAKAQAAANIAELTVKRYQKLLGTQYISKQEYDQALADAQQATAAVVAAKAAVETARINLAYTKVTSPISGRIGKSSVTEGALVQNGQASALATVQQLDPIYVDVTQSSNDFLRLKQELANGSLKQENGKAKVDLVTSDGIKFPQSGTLEFSDVTVDQTTGSIALRAIFPNPDHTLLPGMFVRARLQEGTKPTALLVPQQGVTRTPRGDATVLVVGADNKVETRQIVASQAIGDKWLVTDGLKAGDRVVVSGLQKVRPGAQVKVQEITADNKQQAASGDQPAQPRS
ncbi:TPA_asm: multidrug efflux RND transporter periplasmic adaptor subunit AcrA [Salmonella enterica subsp. enterica serovar Enteritidis]|uniref:Multidrug efflux RND transporter periplasmic adaptor subunit AcrA n=2 Tax=Salmonella enterica I TaxID=59201 RepID=A0A3X9LY57_SALET|nr:multidrug efflux pump subunit AcrA [Salmonella enterica subsp. enterica serovar Enteritidis]ECG9632551.1 multidrug efflux RND transporter periplasmic adaptor subunit AcrA [Salmonella enterica]ECN1172653.1 multidrug efflux RND transporter periplasmic adaptor subunit AcrA [Salmonella enterica subsp. enterica serovar Typhimurium]HAD2298869.1 multidrug efflux RND transporter periplasmic adaptor subunit AcrA [Salmonella enterica subsp. enterica]EAB5536668.1 multidrug efflux RND transporter peripl